MVTGVSMDFCVSVGGNNPQSHSIHFIPFFHRKVSDILRSSLFQSSILSQKRLRVLFLREKDRLFNMLFSRSLLFLILSSHLQASHAFTCAKGLAFRHQVTPNIVQFSSNGDEYDDWYADFDPSEFEAPRPARSSNRGQSHGYRRDTSRDNSNVNMELVESLIQQRVDARSQRDFQLADKIRDQLLQEHGVRILDKEMSWRTGCSDSGSGANFGRESRGAGRPESRRSTPDRNFGPNGHDYQRVGPSVANESEIHAAIAERLQCKLNRNFRRADQIQNDLISKGVFIHDGTKQWKADGQPFETRADKPIRSGRQVQSYSQSPHSEYSDDLQQIEELVAARTAAKAARDFRKADDIREELRTNYNVIFDDRLCQWSVGGDFGSSTPNTRKDWKQSANSPPASPHDVAEIEKMLEERNAARLVRNYKEADSIRDELREMFNVLINDRESEWWVEQPRGRSAKGRSERNEFTSDTEDEEEDEDDSVFGESTKSDDSEQLAVAEADDLDQLTVVALKEKLRELGLPVSGKKSELIARLTSSS